MASENVGSGDVTQDVSGTNLEAVQELAIALQTAEVLPGQGLGQTAYIYI